MNNKTTTILNRQPRRRIRHLSARDLDRARGGSDETAPASRNGMTLMLLSAGVP